MGAAAVKGSGLAVRISTSAGVGFRGLRVVQAMGPREGNEKLPSSKALPLGPHGYLVTAYLKMKLASVVMLPSLNFTYIFRHVPA